MLSLRSLPHRLARPVLTLILSGLVAAPLAAQPQAPMSDDIVVVAAGGKTKRISPDQLRGAVEAFDRSRLSLSPAASLRWFILAAGSSHAFSLWLRSKQDTVPVAIADDGSFVLPADRLRTGAYSLMVSGAAKTVRIRPLALSPGSTRTDFRFGDARLTCEVLWGFTAPRTNLVARGLFRAAGGCHSRRLAIYFLSERPVRDVAIDGWSHRIEVWPDRLSWRVPLFDRTIPNDARVRIDTE